MVITTFNRNNCGALRMAVDVALARVGEQFGIQLKVGNGTFTAESYRFRVEAAVRDSKGEAVTKEQLDYKRYYTFWRLPKDSLGNKVVIEGEEYIIMGARPRSKRTPIVVKSIASKRSYRVTVEAVRSALGVTNAAQA